MTDYGVTKTGFVRERLAEIRTEVTEALKDNFQKAGLSGDIETRPDSIFGIFIDTFSERVAALWESNEGTYSAMYPSTASGVNLDAAVSFTGVTRRAATKSKGYALLYGTAGTVVPNGSRIENTATSEIWEVVGDTSISTTSAGYVLLAVSGDIAAAAQYVLRLDGTIYSYTVPTAGSAAADVMAGLAAAATDAAPTLTVNGDNLEISADAGSSFVIAVSTNLQISKLASPAIVQTVDASILGADIGTLTEIADAVTGWDSVNNTSAAIAGSAAESDSELRNRYSKGMYTLGGATIAAIAATIKDQATGVTTVIGYENTSDYTDMVGRPPHSLHMIIEGGLDQEVAQAIYDSKAAGIDTFGDTTVSVTNTMGVPMLINFDRPEAVYVWIKASVTLLDSSEQAFPDSGLTDIQDALVSRGQELTIGDDVIWQSFFRAVYDVSGVAYATLLFATSSDPSTAPSSSAYTAANIEITDRQKAMFDASRVEVSNGS